MYTLYMLIYIYRVPLPVCTEAEGPVNDGFFPSEGRLLNFSIFLPSRTLHTVSTAYMSCGTDAVSDKYLYVIIYSVHLYIHIRVYSTHTLHVYKHTVLHIHIIVEKPFLLRLFHASSSFKMIPERWCAASSLCMYVL